MNNNFFPKKIEIFLIFGLQAVTAFLQASDFREPLLLQDGPLRYLFESEGDKLEARWWSGFYSRYANKTFTDSVGRDFAELPALFFGKDEFRMTEIFPNCNATMNNVNYNPLLRTTKLRLRANYNETGCVVGFCADYPFYSNGGKPGRFGIRGSVPFKRCWVDKIDTGGVKMGADLQDVVVRMPMRRSFMAEGDPNQLSSAEIKGGAAVMIRLDFLEALPNDSVGTSYLNFNSDSTGHSITSGGKPMPGNSIRSGNMIDVDVAAIKGNSLYNQSFGLVFAAEGDTPRDITNFVDPTAISPAMALPVSGIIDDMSSIYYFDKNVDYIALSEETLKDVTDRLKTQDIKAQLWAIPIAQKQADGSVTIPSGPLGSAASNLVPNVGQNIYDWLYDTPDKINFESYHVEHIGDVRLEAFLQQNISDKMLLELSGTVVMPTGGKYNFKHNPYQVAPGNGGHWEFAPGLLLAAQLNNCLTLKADAKYFFVKEADEERSACFKGATIKNFGPKVIANVKWRYFTGSVDINFHHPQANNITCLIGYQFNYKHKDTLKYVSESSIASWLDNELDENSNLVAAYYELDDVLAVSRTDSISHRLRFESSILISGWAELFCGGAWTFMGKNSPAAVDAYAGLHISF